DYLQRGTTFFKKIRNSWWLAHRILGSRARVVYGTVYQVPAEIGPVDISTFGSILLHLRDPFLALANGLRLTRETVIITQPLHHQSWEPTVLGGPALTWLAQRTHAARTWPPLSYWVLLRWKVWRVVQRLLGKKGPPGFASPPKGMVPCMVFLPTA